MQKLEVKNQLVEILNEVLDNPALLKHREIDTINLVNDLGISSITFIELIVKIEDNFGIEIPVDKLAFEYFQEINALSDMIINMMARHDYD